MRGQGRVFHPTWTDPTTGARKVAKTWRLDYSVNGVRHEESARTTSKREALALLHERLGDRRAGKLTGSPDRVTLHDLRVLVERQYELDGRRSKKRVEQCWTHLESFLGADTRALDVTPSDLDRYAAARLAAGKARQTANNELAALRRGYKLAIEKGLLATMPVIKLPKVRNARSGFFSAGDLAALELLLPPDVQPLVRFLAATGWRVSEAQRLTWDAVDWEAQVIRLAAADTKGGEARLFPFADAPDLKALLEGRWKVRRGLFVFHRGDGTPIKSFRRSWARACKRAGLEGRLVHDLRRSFARGMRTAGVSEGEIMRLAGWRSRSMFDRYNIIDEADLSRAVARRYGQVPSKSEAPAALPESLTSSDITTPL